MKTTCPFLPFLLLLLGLSLACQTVTRALQGEPGVEPATAPPLASPVTEASPAAPTTTPTEAAPPTEALPPTAAVEPTSPPTLAEALQRFEDLPVFHDDDVEYPETGLPPPGGVHASIWQNCGVYDRPVEAKNVLHSLEHGAVWLAYQPELPEAEVQQLRALVENEPYVVMSPFPGLRSPVVLTAWGLQFETGSVDDPRIAEFVSRYQQGPQTPEPGATCQGGLGFPLAPGSL
ncbi:MAG: DUF3105 domain-containing protein [Chloroflexi bacterium]|nr:DUF3105 domain-containing protein [Chloroflexota bacterium]MCI0646540.1 DUF3105 domain-containing protein [Chloroflexota bacterium]MCI0726342.1 DUF3105 domain-containing protein [Chloroflexota bacterium]